MSGNHAGVPEETPRTPNDHMVESMWNTTIPSKTLAHGETKQWATAEKQTQTPNRNDHPVRPRR